MSTSDNARREHPSTYFVQDRTNQEEVLRLQLQGQMTTTRMGGPLPEQTDPTVFETVLDVGCGTGDWLIEAAKTYPTMKRLVGIDVGGKLLEYARREAAVQGVSDRVEFEVMDALSVLRFPSETFDLVNQRFGAGWLRKWDWPKRVQEYQRVCKPGGVLRLTEGDLGVTDSPALARLFELGVDALWQAGHLFTATPDGLTSQLAGLLQHSGLKSVQTRSYTLSYQAGTQAWQSFAEDMHGLFSIGRPFLQKWTRLPEDYEALYQQMIAEIEQPDYHGTMNLLTVCGTRM